MSHLDHLTAAEALLYILARETPEVATFRFRLMYNHGLVLASLDQNRVGFELYGPVPVSKRFQGRLTPKAQNTAADDLRAQGSWIFRLDEDGCLYQLLPRELIAATRYVLDREPTILNQHTRRLTDDERVTVATHLNRAGRPVEAT